jgi:SEL1 protein
LRCACLLGQALLAELDYDGGEGDGAALDPVASAFEDECVARGAARRGAARRSAQWLARPRRCALFFCACVSLTQTVCCLCSPSCAPHARLSLREEQLFGPLPQRDVAAALAGLRALAVAVPAQQPSAPVGPATRVSHRVAAGSDALFVLAALSFAGVLPAGDVAWDEEWAAVAMGNAASTGNLEASLALGDRLVHGRGSVAPDCEAGLPFLRAAADEVLRRAEASADHTVPHEPVRLRDRLRDGAWAAREEDENAPHQLRMEEDLAARGVPEAQRHLGYRRLLGRGIPVDVHAAAAAFAEAARAGDEYAAFNLGYMHMRGVAGDKNYSAAAELFAAAATKDLPAAFNGQGVLLFNGFGCARNYTAARLAFEEGAARGDPDAHFNLGMIFSGGFGVPPDAAAALASFEAASEAGHWRAPHTLAGMHAEGNGTPHNCSRAARLVSLFVEERLDWSAEVGEALKAYDAGDAGGALARLALLAAQGCEVAASNAAFMLRAGHAAWLPREHALERAVALLRFAAARGGVDAHVDLGDIAAASGDAAGAQAHYSDAEAGGSAEGMFSLGWLHLLRRTPGGERNLTAAAAHFNDAWDAAPTEEAVIPPALALAAVHMLAAAERAAAALAAVQWATVESGVLAALTVALAAVMHRRLQLRAAPPPLDVVADE